MNKIDQRAGGNATRAMTPTLSQIDFAAVFIVGAAIATGNPAFADYGLASIILPLLLAGIIVIGGALNGALFDALTPWRWLGAGYIAFIFLWYEQYKLLGHPGSVDLFTTLTDFLGFHGYEKVMRIGTGSCEIIASLFILTPPVQGLGGIGALMLMSGAILFHLATPLGVDPYGDGGVLFKEACSVWISAVAIIWWRRAQLLGLARRFGLGV